MASAEKRIVSELHKRFQNNEIAPAHFGRLLTDYFESGLSAPNLIAEIETGDEGKLWSGIWEAMLYRHLRSLGYRPRNFGKASGQHGPDFGIDHDGRTVWIDAVVPLPQGVPADWLTLGQPGQTRTKPDSERVLRCTSAIADKRTKFATDQGKGIIGPNDCTVIAINICRLSDWDIDGNGISQLPLAMEAVFPIGPLGVPISRDGNLDGPARNIPRFSVKKQNGSEVETFAFLDPRFANVSAVMQAHQKDLHEKDLVLSTVHNPLATNQLPTGLFGVRKEFVAQAEGDGYQLRDVRLEARLRELIDDLILRFRCREDRVVRPATVLKARSFVGERGKCHENVRRWCFMPEHFAHMPARGSLISGEGVLDKHSVVNIGAGEPIEITPMPNDVRRTFLSHGGTEDEFWTLPNQLVIPR
jgi:hypothetical protein